MLGMPMARSSYNTSISILIPVLFNTISRSYSSCSKSTYSDFIDVFSTHLCLSTISKY